MSVNYPTFKLNFDISPACVGQKCSCWNAEDLKTASEKFSSCDLSTVNKNVAKFKESG